MAVNRFSNGGIAAGTLAGTGTAAAVSASKSRTASLTASPAAFEAARRHFNGNGNGSGNADESPSESTRVTPPHSKNGSVVLARSVSSLLEKFNNLGSKQSSEEKPGRPPLFDLGAVSADRPLPSAIKRENGLKNKDKASSATSSPEDKTGQIAVGYNSPGPYQLQGLGMGLGQGQGQGVSYSCQGTGAGSNRPITGPNSQWTRPSGSVSAAFEPALPVAAPSSYSTPGTLQYGMPQYGTTDSII
jgi:hypothetical protein